MFNDPQFWILVAFIIFVGSIISPVRKILIKGLDKKIIEIRNKIDEGEKLKNEAQNILSNIKKRQNEVKNEISKLQEETQEKIVIVESEIAKKLNDQINKKRVLANLRIEQITREANLAVHEYISKVAILASVDLLIRKLDTQEKQNLINKSIKEFEFILKN